MRAIFIFLFFFVGIALSKAQTNQGITFAFEGYVFEDAIHNCIKISLPASLVGDLSAVKLECFNKKKELIFSENSDSLLNGDFWLQDGDVLYIFIPVDTYLIHQIDSISLTSVNKDGNSSVLASGGTLKK